MRSATKPKVARTVAILNVLRMCSGESTSTPSPTSAGSVSAGLEIFSFSAATSDVEAVALGVSFATGATVSSVASLYACSARVSTQS